VTEYCAPNIVGRKKMIRANNPILRSDRIINFSSQGNSILPVTNFYCSTLVVMLADLRTTNTIPLKSIILNRPSSNFINKIARTSTLPKTRKATILYALLIFFGIILCATVTTNRLLYGCVALANPSLYPFRASFEFDGTTQISSKSASFKINGEFNQCRNTEQGKDFLL
jgi:hypothetical protein